ncbi:Deoxycytidylate deaminase [Geodia barretti]|nr:Deoxycytidylate deaminase [Geodia barretti]
MTKEDQPGKQRSEPLTIVVDLDELTANPGDVNEREEKYKGKRIKLQRGSKVSNQSFFPLAVDDYFMSIAILSQRLGSADESKRVGACIVSNESLRVVSLGYRKEDIHAELSALLNAKVSGVDLTKCSLYTTKPPCLNCTQAILEAGIRVMVYGPKGVLDPGVCALIYGAKACFKEYKCYIRIDDVEKRFLIDLHESDVCAKEFDPPEISKPDAAQPTPSCKPSYSDFFMAMAFLSHTRAKDMKYQVGACLVTPAPHRLVAMGYNGMPDGRGFKDDKMDWGTEQSKYICHAELNAIIAAFRREADLSTCTLYVTHTPCDDCSKLVAQSGIKYVVFARPFHNGSAMNETLKRLPHPEITQYDMESECGNIAIDLKDLSIKLSKSSKTPPNDCAPAQKKGRRDVDFPLDDYFMSLAVLAKCRSVVSERVGACLVYKEPRRAISVGYSGNIDGLSDNKKTEYVCCAEFNAIVSAYRYHADLTSATLYTTGVPCSRCATKIIQSGIKTIVHGGEEKSMEPEAREVFYWGKVATLKYECQTKKPIIEIDLRRLVVDQREDGDGGGAE